MNKIKNYLKNIGITIGLIIIFSFFINLLNYFDILNNKIYKTTLIFFVGISVFIGSYLLGKNSKKNGYIEGIKFGTIICIFMLMSSYLMFNYHITLNNFIYYLILIITSVIGSIFGINKKINQKND